MEQASKKRKPLIDWLEKEPFIPESLTIIKKLRKQ